MKKTLLLCLVLFLAIIVILFLVGCAAGPNPARDNEPLLLIFIISMFSIGFLLGTGVLYIGRKVMQIEADAIANLE